MNQEAKKVFGTRAVLTMKSYGFVVACHLVAALLIWAGHVTEQLSVKNPPAQVVEAVVPQGD